MVYAGKSAITKILISLLVFPFLIIGQDDWYETEYKKSGFSVTAKGWFILAGETGYRSTAVDDVDNPTEQIRRDFDFGDDGVYGELGLRYEVWGESTVYSINMAVGYNGTISDDADLSFTNTNISTSTINNFDEFEKDTDGSSIEFHFGPGFGYGSEDGISLEFGIGFYYQKLSLEIDGPLNLSTGLDFGQLDYEANFLGMTTDLTIKIPLDSNQYFWLKLFGRFFPYTFVDNVTKSSTVKLVHRGHDGGSAVALEASILSYLYRGEAWAIRLETGYRYFHWNSKGQLKEDFKNKSSGEAFADQNSIDFVKIRQKGPFVAMTVEF